MKLKIVLASIASVASMAVSVPASAAILLFDFVGPSGTAQFQLDSIPTPDFNSTFIGSDQFGFNNVPGTFGGVAGTASTISFGNGIFASLNIVAPNLGFTQFSSPTLFTGSGASPTFTPGTFALVNPFFGNGRLTISQAASAVPEPSTWAMMLIGFGVMGAMMRSSKRRQKQKVKVTYA